MRAQPDVAEGHANLASAYKDAARQDVAIASYRRALSLRPDSPEAFANLVHSLQVERFFLPVKRPVATISYPTLGASPYAPFDFL